MKKLLSTLIIICSSVVLYAQMGIVGLDTLESKKTETDTAYIKSIFNLNSEIFKNTTQVDANDTTLVTKAYVQDSISGGTSPWSETGDSVYVTGKNVGIGTSSPDYELDVNGDIKFNQAWINASDSTGANLFRLNNPESDRVNIGWGGAGGANIELYSKYHATRQGDYTFTYGGGNFGDLIFTHYDGSSFDEVMKIDSVGNVGIGRTTLTEKLEVQGRGYFYNQDASDAAIIAAINTDGIGGATFTMKDDASGGYWDFKTTQTTGDFKLRDQQNSNDVVYIEAGASANSLFIDTDGLFGINNASPAYRFDVVENSTSYISKMYNSNADGQGLWVQAGNVLNDDYSLRLELQNGIDLFSVKTDGGVFMNYIANTSQSYVLGYNASTKEVTYFTTPSGGGVSELSDLSDVNTSTPTSGNLLIADGVDWESKSIGGDMTLNLSGTLTATTTLINGKGENTSLASNDRMLLYDASGTDLDYVTLSTLDTYFGGGASQLTDLSDVSSATATSGNMLIANGSTFASQSMSGDVTINSSGVTAVSDDSHNHTASTLSGVVTSVTAGTGIDNSGTQYDLVLDADFDGLPENASQLVGSTDYLVIVDGTTSEKEYIDEIDLDLFASGDASGNAPVGYVPTADGSGGTDWAPSGDMSVKTEIVANSSFTGTSASGSFTYGASYDVQIAKIKMYAYAQNGSVGYYEGVAAISTAGGISSAASNSYNGNISSIGVSPDAINNEFDWVITASSSATYYYKIIVEYWVFD